MCQRMFETLEDRRLMSVASDLGLLDLDPQSHFGPQTQAMAFGLNGGSSSSRPITHGAGASSGVDIAKMAGKFKETGSSTFFTDRITIKRVTSTGSVKGTLSIAWIVSDAPMKGTISADGRFRLKFEKDRGFGTIVGGTYVGKMSSDGNKLNGTLDWGYSKDGSGGGSPHKQTFVKYGKGS